MESNNQIRKKWCVYKHSDEKKTEEKRQKPSQLALLVSYSHSLGFANTIRCQQMYFGSDIRWFIIKSSKNKVATIIKEKKKQGNMWHMKLGNIQSDKQAYANNVVGFLS